MSNRIYIKPNPVKEDIQIDTGKSESIEIEISAPLVKTMATQYSKAEGILKPEVFVVVFSNGEVREENYFKWMKRNCAKLRLEFFSNPISPDDLFEDVKKKKMEYESTANKETPDKYYTITDMDHFRSVIVRSKPEYEKEGIQLIISNPCFEVWLYYSKRSDKFEGFVMPRDQLKISQEVKLFLNNKISGGCNPKKAVFDIQQNIVHARTNYEEDDQGIPSLFATNMFLLAEDILPYIKEELEKVFPKAAKRE